MALSNLASYDIFSLTFLLGIHVSSDDDYHTPMHYAAGNSNDEMIKLLLKHGAKIDPPCLADDKVHVCIRMLFLSKMHIRI